MATKPKPTKIKVFFESHRRKSFLIQWIQLCNKAGVSSIKMDLRLPLLGQSYVGMNAEIGEPFNVMAKQDSKTDRSAINIEAEGMTLEIFSTDTSREPWVSSTGAKMMKFCVLSTGEGEKKEVNLQMVVYVPFSEQMMKWASIHLHKDFWIEAVYSNSEMDYSAAESEEFTEDNPVPESGADSGEADDEEEDIPFEEPEPVEVASRTPKKSGSKDLAAYHAEHPDSEEF